MRETQCNRCPQLESEARNATARAEMAESQARILRLDLEYANGRIAQLETEAAAYFAGKGVQ